MDYRTGLANNCDSQIKFELMPRGLTGLHTRILDNAVIFLGYLLRQKFSAVQVQKTYFEEAKPVFDGWQQTSN